MTSNFLKTITIVFFLFPVKSENPNLKMILSEKFFGCCDSKNSFRSSRVEISRVSFFRLKLGFGKSCSNVSKIALFELEFRAI